jgi:hypothetical protein
MSIKYPASTSDCLAFESSKLYEDLEKGLLAEGLCIFGENACINSPFVATPYPNVSGGYKDAYNFFHSQLRIHVECAFGMFVHRWGILRSPIPCGISIRKIHNFCIDPDDTLVLPSTSVDELRLVSQTNGSVPLEHLDGDYDDMADDNTTVPRQLINGGEHFDDLPSNIWQLSRQRYLGVRIFGCSATKRIISRGHCEGEQLPTTKTKRDKIACLQSH